MIRERGGAFVPDRGIPADHLARYEWAAPQVKGRRVLDAGSGYGYGSDYLAAHGVGSVLGVDTDPEAVRFARVHYHQSALMFALAKIQALRSATFDAVISFEVLEHVRDASAYVSELVRLVRPGGWLFLSTPNRAFTEKSYVDGHSPNPFHLREYYAREVAGLLQPHFSSVACFHEENPDSYWTYSDHCWVPGSVRRLVPKTVKDSWLKTRGVERGGVAGRFRFTAIADPRSFPDSWGAQVFRCQK